MKANQTRQNGRNYKKALCGYAAMGAVMILGASGGALLAVQAAETETETVLTGEVQMSGSRSAAWSRRRTDCGCRP